LLYGPNTDKLLLKLQLTSEENVSRHVQMLDILNTFCAQTLANLFAFFMCFWFKWLLSIVSAFFAVLMLDGR